MKELKYFLIAILAAATCQIQASSFIVKDLELRQGTTAQLWIGLDNTESDLSGFQFRLNLPAGTALTTDSRGRYSYVLSERIGNYTLSITPMQDGSYQFIAYSLSANAVSGNSGLLMEVSLTATTAAATTAFGSLTGVKVTNLASQTARYPDCSFTITTIPVPVDKDFTIGNIIYHYDKNSSSDIVSVTGNTLSGDHGTIDLIIPETVTFEGTEYTVTSIGDAAFDYCYPLNSVVLPAGVKQLSNRAFRGCSYLTSVLLPEGLESIGTTDFQSAMGTFHHCSRLKDITIPSTVTLIGRGAFSGCSSLIAMKIPDSVTTIGSCAFDACTGLKDVTLPTNITEIALETFRYCSALTAITIPCRVTNIATYAFSGCSSLTSVTVQSTTPCGITSTSFLNCPKQTLHVPKGSKAAYASTDFWKEFPQIVEYSPEDADILPGDANCDGSVDVVDVTTVVDFILQKTVPSDTQRANADVNKDQAIDVVDLTSIVSIILGTYGK